MLQRREPHRTADGLVCSSFEIPPCNRAPSIHEGQREEAPVSKDARREAPCVLAADKLRFGIGVLLHGFQRKAGIKIRLKKRSNQKRRPVRLTGVYAFSKIT